MTLFDETNAPYSDSNTTTLTEPQPANEAQAEQAEQSVHDAHTHDEEASSLGHVEPGDEKPVPAASDDFASALDSFTAEAEEAAGEDHVLKGTVLKLTATHVVVDIGAKSEGMLLIAEVLDHEGKPKVQPGDEIDVMREKGETEEGYINLSFQKAQKLRAWDEIEKAYSENQPIRAVVAERTKGGVTVDILGAHAFLPGSQIDLRPVRNLDGLKGQSFDVAIVKLNKKRGNIVVSRKQLLEQEQNEKKSKVLAHLQEGSILTGVVKNLTEYGAFVDLGGIDGLLHITDMSWGRVNHPSEVFQVGDEVQVKVLKYNPETERVSLGLKQTQEDPWNHVDEAYPLGKRVRGKVMSLTEYGAFVELEAGVEGLIHVSEMSWTKKVKHPSKLVEPGQEIECQVLEVDAKAKRISLGLKQLEPDPWTIFTEKYRPGDKIGGKVRSLTDYGVFVGIEEGVDGMVHKSDLSWTVKVNNPADLYHKNDDVEAIILSINHDEKKVSLGIKQLVDDPWPTILNDLPTGTVVEALAISIVDYGLFVRIRDGIEALIPSSDLVEEEGSKIKV